jgi:predicted RNA polymerase sigma factor
MSNPVEGPAEALKIVDGISGLDDTYLLPSVRGELLSRMDRHPEAADEFDRAAAASQNELERKVLEDKATRARAAAR